MTDRQLRFRVGLFVLVALGAVGWLVFQFGKLNELLAPKYLVAIHVTSAAGVHAGTPVRQHGIVVGRVAQIRFDEKRGGVLLVVEVEGDHRLREGTHARLVATLLGATTIDLQPGEGERILPPNSLIRGIPPADPYEIVDRMEERMARTLASFEQTSTEWSRVGSGMNTLLDENQGRLHEVVEKTAVALEEFAATMRTANGALANADKLLGDEELRSNIARTLATLPELATETKAAVAAMRKSVDAVEANLANLQDATAPLAQHSRTIVTRLDETLANLQSVSSDLEKFAKTLQEEDGTVQRLMTDPSLYRNLDNSAASLAALMRNLEPAIRDLRIFSDKVARHPELIGVGGALRGSSGVKEVDPALAPAPAPMSSPPRTAARRPGDAPRAAIPR